MAQAARRSAGNRGRTILGTGIALFCAAAAGARAQERTLRFEALDNGAFDATRSPRAPQLVPWWHSDGRGLRQPFAAHAPLAASLRISGEVRGPGRLVLRASEGEAKFAVGDRSGDFAPFAITADEAAGQLGGTLTPRFELLLESDEDAAVEWRALTASVELPLPDEDALRREIVVELERIFALWLERGRDDVGPRETALFCHLWDVADGRRLSTGAAGAHPLALLLRRAAVAEPRADWDAAFDRFFLDFTDCCLHPVSGMPRMWDPKEDRPRDDRPVEVHKVLEFMLDVAERGPLRHAQRALEAALRIGDQVLAQGIAPDGAVAASYLPESAAPNRDVSPLRALDVPAQLARLGRLADDWRYARAAREACVALEYEHVWPGTWDAIDPGFDDIFGHYGARAATMWRAYPDDDVFGGLVLSGVEHYAPIWHDALRLGGNVAADQVRCWEIYRDAARLAPRTSATAVELLQAAIRSHFKGEQYPGGAWGDVTIYGFDPKAHLQVGDLPGTPQNLLAGLAALYEGETRTPLVRAMFTAVMRSSLAEYGRAYGMLTTRAESAGDDFNGGELRFALGLVEMLERL